ncbi:uncharacterized protein PRCAT00001705001 [Priceomyces carsonii]|uniref:uncharacterized protein n=1 Tax=Priceomyces carsonii TaxID=28549 RepID=UPI002ED8B154|nr:unnamed protein product [Priceomyces carsonii]
MPRVSPKHIREAKLESRLLPYLLRVNGGLSGAKRELRWMQKEVPEDQLYNAVKRRSKFEPLQYILGSQPFGPLDILCRKNVLIPRPETEEWVSKLADLLCTINGPLKIIDACSGSGCVTLLLNHVLQNLIKTNFMIEGFDVSADALKLSKDNLTKYEDDHYDTNVKFKIADVLDRNVLNTLKVNNLDLVVSNPPYIPLNHYMLPLALDGIEKSVREYEPSLALVGAYEFYEALIKNLVLPLRASGFVFELGYRLQASEVQRQLTFRTDSSWCTGISHDSNGVIRCIVGWKPDSQMSRLKDLCDEVYEI